MTCGLRFQFKGGRLIQAKITKTDMGLLKCGHGRLIEVAA